MAAQLTTGSGLPFTPVSFAPWPAPASSACARGSPACPSQPVSDGSYVNPAAYAAPLPGTWGDAGRNSIRGPAQFSLDASVARVFRLRGRLNLEWRSRRPTSSIASRSRRSTPSSRARSSAMPTLANPMRRLQTTCCGFGSDHDAAALAAVVARADHRRRTQTAPPTFRASTHLVVQTVSVKDKNGKPIEGLTAQRLRRHRGRPAAGDCVRRVPAARRRASAVHATAVEQRRRRRCRHGDQHPPSPVPLPGDARYRGRRLLVLYFDLYNMPFFDQIRMYPGRAPVHRDADDPRRPGRDHGVPERRECA